ncbi:hypothetical protein GCM10010411_75300 [Actinomadura fulvescens]|uniref:Uncharacterized protein n=1 Tax=Actinomadura fulvescens TaxID=46160 RepID=A0ABN3QI89_9ACTN
MTTGTPADDPTPQTAPVPQRALPPHLAAQGYRTEITEARRRAAADLRDLGSELRTLTATLPAGTGRLPAIDHPAELLAAATRLARQLPDLVASLAAVKALETVDFLVADLPGPPASGGAALTPHRAPQKGPGPA